MMGEYDDPPARGPDYENALLERLRAVACERDGVPEYVLAAARSIFVCAHGDHPGA
jgi:hypothetical protein